MKFEFSSRDPSGFLNPTKNTLIVFPEGWSCRPNTVPGSRELLCNDCSSTIATTRDGMVFHQITRSQFQFVAILSVDFFHFTNTLVLFSVVSVCAKTKIVTCLSRPFRNSKNQLVRPN